MENETNAPNNSQAQTEAEKKAKEAHDALYGKYSQSRKELYEVTKMAFEASPETILKITDEEIKNKLVKEQFGFDTFDEAKAILGEAFYKKDDTIDKIDTEKVLADFLKQQKINEYKQTNKAKEDAIKLFVLENKQEFEGIDAPIEKLKEEIKKFSSDLPIEQVLETAKTLIKVKEGKNISFATTTAGNKPIVDGVKTTTGRSPEMAKLFGNKI